MHRITLLSRHRVAAAVAGLALGAGLIAGCGDDDGEEGGEDAAAPAALEITASESQNGDVELAVPESAEAGVTEITMVNEGEQPHSGQLIRVEGERTEEEVLEGLGAAQEGEAFPDWFFAGGGTGTVAPGESASVTQDLEPDSTYWLVDDEARGRPPMVPIEITGEGSDAELPASDNVVTALDFSFEGENLTAGEPITFKNDGEQPHHMIAVPFTDEEATIEDVETFFQEEEGQPPVDFESGVFTSVLEGGTEQVSAAEFESGRYALVCFISNREGGPPHVEMGMIDEVEVE
jgi:hypothetical protein